MERFVGSLSSAEGRSKATLVAILLASLSILTLVLTGCSGPTASDSHTSESSATSRSSAGGEFPVSIPSDTGGDVTVKEKPNRIVSLSASATETLYAIGAGDAVVAADKYSTYPEEAPNEEGLSGRSTNAEALLTYDPDLVVVSFDAAELVSGLTAVGVPVLVVLPPTTVNGAYEQVERLGVATGHAEEADAVAADMKAKISDTVEKAAKKGEGKTYFHEVTIDYYTVSNNTFLGDVYRQFGLTSIAPDDASGYPQLTEESIIASNPDYIFLVDHTSEQLTPEQVAARPGWQSITAVKEGRIIPLDEDLASRWGPRLPEFVQQIADSL